MKRKMFALVLVLAAGSLAQSLAQTTQWVEVSPPGGKSLVMMPTKPQESTETKNSEVGEYTSHLFMSKVDGVIYIFGWVDYRPGLKLNVEGEINANRDNFLKGVEARLVSERKIEIDGNPGVEFVGASAGHNFKTRAYLVGARPYMLATAWLKDQPEPPGVATFLYSFRLEK